MMVRCRPRNVKFENRFWSLEHVFRNCIYISGPVFAQNSRGRFFQKISSNLLQTFLYAIGLKISLAKRIKYYLLPSVRCGRGLFPRKLSRRVFLEKLPFIFFYGLTNLNEYLKLIANSNVLFLRKNVFGWLNYS